MISVMMQRVFPLLVLGFGLMFAGGAAAEDAVNARISVIPETTHIAAGQTVTIGIRQDIAAGWHTYWRNAGDSGEPMRLRWDMPDGFTAGDITFPAPQKIITGPLASYGYYNDAVMLVPLTAPASLAEGAAVTMNIRATTLVCADICIPENADLTVTFNDGPDAGDPAAITAARAKIPAMTDIGALYEEADGQFILHTGKPLAAGGVLAPVEWGMIDNLAGSVQIDENTYTHKRGDRALRAIGEAEFLWLSGDDTIAFIARPSQAVTGAVASDQTAAPQDASTTIDTSETTPKISPIKFWQAALFAFLGGMVLNLMPCVFPVLFMKALSLCQISQSEEREARLQALLYTAGILASFAVVAGVLLALRSAGAQLGWGFQLQSPPVIMALAVLFALLTLNLAGLFEFSGRFAGTGQGVLARTGKHGHSFFMGVLATIVATPCTAPFMGAALGYAVTQNALIAMAVFMALGLGLAAPYVALSFIPALRNRLPKPGAWMDTFRRVLAMPMALTVAWLGWVYVNQTGAWADLTAALLLTVAAASLWRGQWTPRLRTLLSAAFLAGALLLGLQGAKQPVPQNSTATPSAQAGHYNGSTAYSPATLAGLLAGDGAVFVNMTADWCITCKVNERIALRGFDFAGAGVTYLVGDWTRQDEDITRYLSSFGRTGVPLYVFYGARDTATGQRPDPVVLPQILTPAIVSGVME